DNMSEGSDIDKSSDNTSITTSSLSDNESNWSSPENNTDNDEFDLILLDEDDAVFDLIVFVFDDVRFDFVIVIVDEVVFADED
ncbi:unnamed protein product, partial [Rotaria socialis]